MASVQMERFYLGCLAHASYMISSQGVAAVIDPRRDVDIYLETAAAGNLKIEYIIETHLHADFVSGHHELAERTGARIYLGAGSGAEFPHVPVEDGDELQFGDCCLRFLHTPGHTLESICILMNDRAAPDHPGAVFTGDTLFVGDVGRPDLAPGHSPQQLATMLYTSIHEKLLTLPDDTEILPAHGAGSLCGRQMSSESSSTIGKQRKSNYALMARSSEEFVHLLTDNLPARPDYFARDAELNRRGAASLAALPPLAALSAPEVLRLQQDGAVTVDTRPAMDSAVAHVPGSVNIPLTGQYASWAARILGLDKPLILVGEDAEHVRESQMRLARVGIENIVGYLADGVAGWIQSGLKLDSIPQITVQDLAELRNEQPDQIAVLDVREPGEVASGMIEHALCIPLGKLESSLSELSPNQLESDGQLLVVHCKSGYRSSIAASLLQRAGFQNVANLIGGFDAWKTASLPCTIPASAGA